MLRMRIGWHQAVCRSPHFGLLQRVGIRRNACLVDTRVVCERYHTTGKKICFLANSGRGGKLTAICIGWYECLKEPKASRAKDWIR